MKKTVLRKVKNIRTVKNRVILETDPGKISLSVIAANCFRITWYPDGNIPAVEHSWAIEKGPKPSGSFRLDRSRMEISTSELKLKIFSNPLRFAFYDSANQLISRDKGSGRTGKSLFCTKEITREEAFFGLGEKTGTLNKRGRSYTMWNTDDWRHMPTTDPLYKSIPFIIGLRDNRAYGIFFDDVCRSDFHVGSKTGDELGYTSEGEALNYYFIYGPGINCVVESYTRLTGRIPMPPKWSLGYHQSRWSYYTEKEVLDIAKKMRKKKIPCDVIHLDIDYMDGYRVFTSDRKAFPHYKEMIAKLASMGFKTVNIVDPGVKANDEKYPVFTEGKKKNYFCKYPDGRLFIGKVWPGDAVFPDFSSPEVRKWWGNLHKFYLNTGSNGIWNDMNEPASAHDKTSDLKKHTMDYEVLQYDNGKWSPHEKLHNAYGLTMTKATAEGLKTLVKNKRFFLLTRSAYAGIQKYSSVWLGDNCSWWEHLQMSMPMCANMGLSGVPFVGVDIGGFGDNANAELLERWMQFGAFLPFCRNHSARRTIDQEPWRFGRRCENIYRRYVELRYRLMPYTYTNFRKAQQKGTPVLRPLVYDYQRDKTTYNLGDEFLFGESFLVAPVFTANTFARAVYLPEGEWVDYWTKQVFSGEGYIMADTPPEILPLYVRAGSIIPMYPLQNYIGEKKIEELTLDIYPGKTASKTTWYEDDGISYNYLKGKYCEVEITCGRRGDTLNLDINPKHISFDPGLKHILVKLNLAADIPAGVKLNGRALNKMDNVSGGTGYSYSGKDSRLLIRIPFSRKRSTISVS